MFFKILRRSGERHRREQGLFYASLVTAVVAFYTLLSFHKLDIVAFLSVLESQGVKRLLSTVPVLYIISIFFVYALVHLAYGYQLQSRQREIGLYLTLGMKRSKLLYMLSLESLWNGTIAFLIGLPVAFLLTEVISLLTAVTSGIGLEGHRIMVDPKAIFFTALGYYLMQIPAIIYFSSKYVRREPAALLATDVHIGQRHKIHAPSRIFFGLLLLAVAYYAGIKGLYMRQWFLIIFVVLAITGIAGTFLIFQGLGGVIQKQVTKKRDTATGLTLFTGRQIQEFVTRDNRSLALASLFLLFAVSFGSYGMSTATIPLQEEPHVMDFTLRITEKEVPKVYDTDLGKDIIFLEPFYFSTSVPAELFDFTSLVKYQDDEELPYFITNLSREGFTPGLIKGSSYNHLRELKGEEPLPITRHHWAFYDSFTKEEEKKALASTIKSDDLSFEWQGETIHPLPQVESDVLSVDREVTLTMTFIVQDDVYDTIIGADVPYFYNGKMSQSFMEQSNFVQSYLKIQQELSKVYETNQIGTYLGSIGRDMFYQVAESSLMLYLGLLFFILVNSLLSTKFLMEFRRILYRYETLQKIGATIEEMEQSIKQQLRTYILPVLGVAYLSSIPAAITIYGQVKHNPFQFGSAEMWHHVIITGVVFLVLLIFELLYLRIIGKLALKSLKQRLSSKRRVV